MSVVKITAPDSATITIEVPYPNDYAALERAEELLSSQAVAVGTEAECNGTRFVRRGDGWRLA